VKQLTRVVHVPNAILAPIVAILCFLGAYVAKNDVFDIWIMVVLGLFAFAAQRAGYPTVPLILGFILAELIEANFHRALAVGFGSYSVFFVRPISLGLIVVTLCLCAFVVKNHEDTKTQSVTRGELFFAGLVTVILSIFLFSAFRYSSAVRLFPLIVSTTGLALTGYWLFNGLISTTPALRATPPHLRRGAGIPAFASLGLLVGYAALVPVVGLMIASVVFFLLVTFIARRREKESG